LTNSYSSYEWKALVVEEQRRILASTKKDPIEILLTVFNLFDESFDLKVLFDINLYHCLQTLSTANNETPISSSLDENYNTIRDLVIVFEKHKNTIREFSVELYYALLNFMDLLKQKNIWMQIMVENNLITF